MTPSQQSVIVVTSVKFYQVGMPAMCLVPYNASFIKLFGRSPSYISPAKSLCLLSSNQNRKRHCSPQSLSTGMVTQLEKLWIDTDFLLLTLKTTSCFILFHIAEMWISTPNFDSCSSFLLWTAARPLAVSMVPNSDTTRKC